MVRAALPKVTHIVTAGDVEIESGTADTAPYFRRAGKAIITPDRFATSRNEGAHRVAGHDCLTSMETSVVVPVRLEIVVSGQVVLNGHKARTS